MDQGFIDEFFETGRLQLSSFGAFKRHADEQRGDKDEGWNVLFGECGGHTLVGLTEHGDNSYVLSASTVHHRQLYEDFKADGCFVIRDSTSFGSAIAASIAGFTEGVEGCCSYQDIRTISRYIGPLNLIELSTNPNRQHIIAEKLRQVAGADAFFIKQMRFRHQNEYRFVWHVSQPVDSTIIVTCKDAIQYCRKMEKPTE